MYLVRNIFNAKPGMVKELVKKWKQTIPYAEKQGLKNNRLLTDVSAGFWTFIYEFEIENLSELEEAESFTSSPEVKNIMAGYMDLVQGGYREIFKVV
jgi:hypothetical protein